MPELLRCKGVAVCLFASPEKIVERTGRNRKRPLLDVDNPEERVRQLLAERGPAYLRCGTAISTEGRTMAETVRRIVSSYRAGAARFAGKEQA
jgi:shikimate kinase